MGNTSDQHSADEADQEEFSEFASSLGDGGKFEVVISPAYQSSVVSSIGDIG